MTNTSIRAASKEYRIPLWKVAESMGIQDYTLSRKLRYELPAAEQKQILDVIKNLAAKEGG